jgi:hypothetical protein
MSCLAQSTVPTPVAARPCEDFVSAILTALWLMHVLHWDTSGQMSLDMILFTYILLCTGLFSQIGLVCCLLDKIRPPRVEARIPIIRRYCLAFQPEVGIDCNKQCVFPPALKIMSASVYCCNCCWIV